MTRRERNDIVGTAPEELSASDRTGNRSRISMATRNVGVSGGGDEVVVDYSRVNIRLPFSMVN
jgi:hypothetical protein